jgi:hypothetical protein
MAQAGSPRAVEALESYISGLIESGTLPALSVSVVKGNRLVWARPGVLASYGGMEIVAEVPNDAEGLDLALTGTTAGATIVSTLRRVQDELRGSFIENSSAFVIA